LTPARVDDSVMRKRMLTGYDVEVGGGLGAFAGKAFRIGLMGHGARRQNVLTLLATLENVLIEQDAPITRGAALPAAHALLFTGG